MDKRTTVAIAGASGFVGSVLARDLARDFRVVGLSRSAAPHNLGAGVEWRQCDLFSLLQCEVALEGVDLAVYLVHSMLPKTHPRQGSFQDMDLLCADNFARAAARAKVGQIVYLGGLIPPGAGLSPHLQSRLDVEKTLGSHGVPVTALRAGIIVGQGGPSFEMLRSLVERIPLILCPDWSRTLTQPAALSDVLGLIRFCVEHPQPYSRSVDVGSPEVMTYRELLERTARVLRLRRVFFDIPDSGEFWYRQWLRWVSGTPMSLVKPILESVRHPMVARDRSFQLLAGVPGTPFEEAVRVAVKAGPRQRPARAVLEAEPAQEESGPKPIFVLRNRFGNDPAENIVRSVQRLALPPQKTARWAAEQYSAWLPRLFRGFLKAETDKAGNVRFSWLYPHVSLLELTFARERSENPDRQVFLITGGFLARKIVRVTGRPRLEFRELLGDGTLLIAIHDYRPALPRPLYRWTQAILHVWVMRRFARHLDGLARASKVSAARLDRDAELCEN